MRHLMRASASWQPHVP
ncbi:unnamed protein product [Gulo gulo]|uniref:Uncharacterized protein n=1 Tax=Gulo gulo TaxID=48420 RepID=A0A9X9LWP8_GULGU|nr:unnamed protein product [Gulo gulo]